MGLSSKDLARLGPRAQRQLLQKIRASGEAKSAKYHNEKAQRVMPNGSVHTFDSQKEARRYDELRVLLDQGRIRKLELQKQFTIQESYITAEGERVRAIRYVADFTYYQPRSVGKCINDQRLSWEYVVEDTKGVKTKDYNIKRKLMLENFGIAIKEI